MSYPKYAWACNKITEQSMKDLYFLKQTTRKPITILVAEAVVQYLKNQKKKRGNKKWQ